MTDSRTIPTWAPRVTQREIRRLYETDAQGTYDEELINEAGYGLLARCQSFLDANEARAGKARCPRCSAVVPHTYGDLRCGCGWELKWAEYLKTIMHVQLSGAEPVLKQFREFLSAFPAARTPQEKMFAIDRLIHGFHWYYKNNAPTRPVAVNLIEGKMSEVVAFLDQLTYTDKSTPGMRENYAQWDKRIEESEMEYPSRQAKKAKGKDPSDKK